MRQLAIEDIAKDLCIAVRVRREAVFGSNPVFVQHAQAPEVREAVVVVAGEAECVEGFEPAAVFGVPAVGGAAGDDFGVGEGF